MTWSLTLEHGVLSCWQTCAFHFFGPGSSGRPWKSVDLRKSLYKSENVVGQTSVDHAIYILSSETRGSFKIDASATKQAKNCQSASWSCICLYVSSNSLQGNRGSATTSSHYLHGIYLYGSLSQQHDIFAQLQGSGSSQGLFVRVSRLTRKISPNNDEQKNQHRIGKVHFLINLTTSRDRAHPNLARPMLLRRESLRPQQLYLPPRLTSKADTLFAKSTTTSISLAHPRQR